jgi:hypothetical protein
MRAVALCTVIATSTAASAGSYEGTVLSVEPGKVVVQLKHGEAKTFALSQTVKENKSPDGYYTLLHRQLVVGMRIKIDSLRKDGIDEAQGFYFIAPP